MINELLRLRIGLLHNGTGVKIVPSDGDEPNGLIFDGNRAYARFLLARQLAGSYFDHKAKKNLWNLDEALLRPYVLSKDDIHRYLLAGGLGITIDEAKVVELETSAQRALAKYGRWIPPHETGEETKWIKFAGDIDKASAEQNQQYLRELGWEDCLFDFAFEEIANCGTKRDVLLAWIQGSGKTRASLALAELQKAKNKKVTTTIIIALKRHLQPWFEEIQKLYPLQSKYGSDMCEFWLETKDKPSLSKPFLFISFERLILLKEDQMNLLIKTAKSSVIVVDELYVVSNRLTHRYARLSRIFGQHHIGLSGTPIKGSAQSALPILNWLFRGGSTAFPDFPYHRENSETRFNERYIQFAVADDGTKKRVPVLKNATKDSLINPEVIPFYDLIAPLMSRKLRGEPPVMATLGEASVQRHRVNLDITSDPQHLEFYEAVLEQFREWYVAMLKVKKSEQALTSTEILIKLGYLRRALAQPWTMKEQSDKALAEFEKLPKGVGESAEFLFKFPEYPRRLTLLHDWAVNKALEEIENGKQVLIASWHTQQLDLLHESLKHVGSGLIHSNVKQEKRNEYIRDFKSGKLKVLNGSYGTMAEALNLGEASVAICVEPDWSPSTLGQLEGRMTRGIVELSPESYWLSLRGTIYDYIYKYASLKQNSMDAGLDGANINLMNNTIPDLQAYAKALANPENKKFTGERRYFLEI